MRESMPNPYREDIVEFEYPAGSGEKLRMSSMEQDDLQRYDTKAAEAFAVLSQRGIADPEKHLALLHKEYSGEMFKKFLEKLSEEIGKIEKELVETHWKFGTDDEVAHFLKLSEELRGYSARYTMYVGMLKRSEGIYRDMLNGLHESSIEAALFGFYGEDDKLQRMNDDEDGGIMKNMSVQEIRAFIEGRISELMQGGAELKELYRRSLEERLRMVTARVDYVHSKRMIAEILKEVRSRR
jgi:hypothetical protein